MTTFVQQMLSNKNTQDLVLELQNGSEAALSQLYDRYSEALYGLVFAYSSRRTFSSRCASGEFREHLEKGRFLLIEERHLFHVVDEHL